MEKELKKYYVDFYDMIDGWGSYGFFTDRLFDDLNEAIKNCDSLNKKLDKQNRMCGEHYGVIDKDTKQEVYCGMDEDYKLKIRDMVDDLFKIKENNSGRSSSSSSSDITDNITEKDWVALEEIWGKRYDEESRDFK